MQDYLDDGLNFMRGQKRPCVDEYGECVLINDKGERCVVGNKLPGWSLSEIGDLEWSDLGTLLAVIPDLKGVAVPLGKDGADLACWLQDLHDHTDRPDWIAESGNGLGPQGEKMAQEIAGRFGLVYNPPS